MVGYGAGVGMVAGVFAVQSVSFVLLCVSTAITGVTQATSQQSRFVAAEISGACRACTGDRVACLCGHGCVQWARFRWARPQRWPCSGGCRPNAGPYLFGIGLLALSLLLTAVLPAS
jgi:hypothetical protein